VTVLATCTAEEKLPEEKLPEAAGPQDASYPSGASWNAQYAQWAAQQQQQQQGMMGGNNIMRMGLEQQQQMMLQGMGGPGGAGGGAHGGPGALNGGGAGFPDQQAPLHMQMQHGGMLPFMMNPQAMMMMSPGMQMMMPGGGMGMQNGMLGAMGQGMQGMPPDTAAMLGMAGFPGGGMVMDPNAATTSAARGGRKAGGGKAGQKTHTTTVERMEKHKMLERKRRERTKDLVAELQALLPGADVNGDNLTMNTVLEEAIGHFKVILWENGERQNKRPCTCGGPGTVGAPMPPRPPKTGDGSVLNASATVVAASEEVPE
jgi:hypothetical protein